MAPTGKTARGMATRQRIVEAATRLFAADGYLSTTITAIAREAGAGVQTVYLAFGSKAAILKAAIDVAVAGDYEDVPVSRRPRADDARAAPDASSMLDILLEVSLADTERAGPIYQVCQAAAADPEVAALLADIGRQRRSSWQEAAEWLSGRAGFRSDLTVERARDILYSLVSPDMWRVLVSECGWSPRQWRDFTRATARAHLLHTEAD
ncbi:MAG: TetR/AcrR family transcriptional regulator [Trebonia sp.]